MPQGVNQVRKQPPLILENAGNGLPSLSRELFAEMNSGLSRTISNPRDQHLPEQINLASKLLIFQESHFEIVMPGAATLGSSVIVI